MYCVIRHWKLKEGVSEEAFFKKYREGTLNLLEEHGSFGASIHKHADGTLWVYARWPDRETQQKAQEARTISGEFSNEPWVDVLETIELDLVGDYLKILPK